MMLKSIGASKPDLQYGLCRMRTDMALWGSVPMQLSISGSAVMRLMPGEPGKIVLA